GAEGAVEDVASAVLDVARAFEVAAMDEALVGGTRVGPLGHDGVRGEGAKGDDHLRLETPQLRVKGADLRRKDVAPQEAEVVLRRTDARHPQEAHRLPPEAGFGHRIEKDLADATRI